MIDEIKKLLGSENLILGTDRTMKELRNGNLVKIFLASNADKKIVEDIEHFKKMAEFEVINLKETNEELGTICKKPFSIAVIGLKK